MNGLILEQGDMMKNLKDMNSEEIVEELIQNGYVTEAKKHNITQLRNILEEVRGDGGFLDGLTAVENDEPNDTPSMTDPEWNSYVLSLFTNEEIFNGSPTADGVRRLVELLIGHIISIGTDIVVASTEYAATKTSVSIETDDGVVIFEGSADAHEQNTDGVFQKYLLAMAETRSFSRAMKKALRLKATCVEETSEEAKYNVPSYDSHRTDGPITVDQVRFIGIQCSDKKCNINVQNLVNKVTPDVHNIYELSHEQALEINSLLSKYQKDIDSIPDSISKFDPTWVEMFGENKNGN